jgi:ribosomal protein L29
MKKILLVTILIIPMLFSCQDREKAVLKAKNDSLQMQMTKRDSTVNSFFASFNEIQTNLDSIKQKEKIITVNATGNANEMATSQKDQINNDIQLINDLMTKNKQKIAHLNHLMKSSHMKISHFQKMIANLTKQIEEKDKEINDLKEQLAKLNFQVGALTSNVDSLKAVNKNKEEIIGQKTTALNTAYYAYGTRKELVANHIIAKEGGFLGMGKSEKLLDNFNKSYFTKIDITKTSFIALYGKRAHLLTSHPSSSYRFESSNGKVDKLIILDANDFWSTSKYLVVVIE